MRNITELLVCLTTKCNLQCPNCCYDTHARPHWDATEGYLREANALLGPTVTWIQLTGGEPMMNPMFDKILPKIKDIFPGRKVTMETNAFLAPLHVAALNYLDCIYATRYSEIAYPGAPNNNHIVDWLHQTFPERTQSYAPTHIPRSRRDGPGVCNRGRAEVATLLDGRVYKCCVSQGIRGAPSVPLTKDWIAQLDAIPYSCGNCCFGEKDSTL